MTLAALVALLLPWIALGEDAAREEPPEKSVEIEPLRRPAAELEKQIHALVNRHRAAEELMPLKLDATISAHARGYSKALAEGKIPIGHYRLPQRLKEIARELDLRYERGAENIAWGFDLGAGRLVKLWLKSETHRQNVESETTLTGIGAYKGEDGRTFFTQIFLKGREEEN